MGVFGLTVRAVLKQKDKQRRRYPFDDRELARAAGAKGGRAQVANRPKRELQALEAGIAASNNGAAKAVLLRIKRAEQAAIDRERYRLDDVVCQLMDEEDRLRDRIRWLRRRAGQVERRLGEGIAGLEAREEDLRRRLEESDDALIEALRPLDEERLARALEALGHEFVDDEEAPDAAAEEAA